MGDQDARLTTSDEELITEARTGDQRAFAELWRRHFRSGARVARQFTSSIDADDLVSEAYTRIYQRVLAGGGPTGAFRPYLYTTIRNLASSWGAASHDIQVDDIADFEDPSTLDDPAALALDRTLTARAFRTLPERWQSVLWYTEVEGMDPHEVAPLLGLTANGVAALSYRAREGLRKAWLQAHISDASASGECHWAISRLGDHARHTVSTRDSERLSDHLATCAKCTIISEEVDEVGSHLAMVLLPILLGGVAGGTLLATLGHAGGAAASAAIPALPASISAMSTGVAFGAPVAAGLSMGAATGTAALIGALAIAATVGGTVAINLGSQDDPQAARPGHSVAEPSVLPAATPTAALGASTLPPKVDPSSVPGVLDPVAGAVKKTVDGLGKAVKRVTNPVQKVLDSVPVRSAVTLHLTGRGTPGATVTASVGGTVTSSTRVDSTGHFSLGVSGVDPAASVQLKQRLTVLGATVPLDVPLSVTAGSNGLSIQLLN
ncbi:MAG: hypothetical protein QOI02_331 [Actinomycetota bacterium]|nr:hypothetical protein [Actinomycetota bacterium]